MYRKKIKRHRVTIVMLNIAGEGYTKYMNRFLKKVHTYSFNDETTIVDLNIWLLKQMHCYDRFNLSEIFAFKINDKEINAQCNYKLIKFIRANNLKKLEVDFRYGAGGGCELKTILATIRINPNEEIHKYTPHVHIYVGKKRSEEYETRIKLDDLSLMKNTKKSLDDLFSNNDKKLLIEFLTKYRDELINYYNSIQKGEQPKSIYIDFKGNITIFR